MYTKFDDYILRQADGACIPMDTNNADYAAYLAWIADGNVADQPVQPTIAELILLARSEMRVQRQPIISILDGLQSSAIVKGETARAIAIETAKQGLRDITDIELFDCGTYAEMRVKVKARYVELATALPADIRQAFSEAVN